MSHDHSRHQAHEEKSGCCGGGKRETQEQAAPRPEPAKPAPAKRGCCG